MTELFRGAGVALVTLFDESGSIDAAATGTLAGDLAGGRSRAVGGEPAPDLPRLALSRRIPCRSAAPPTV